ncbi:hypothetical protein niasHT_031979 [Heterodera trifolii]|uniref:Transposase n=1 Tax=Heterodera trifolii TaxID=157864 RepID=A0ABD2I1E6_9BILA
MVHQCRNGGGCCHLADSKNMEFRAGRNDTKRRRGSGRPSTVDKRVLAIRRDIATKQQHAVASQIRSKIEEDQMGRSPPDGCAEKTTRNNLPFQPCQTQKGLCTQPDCDTDESYICYDGTTSWPIVLGTARPGTILDSNLYINQLRAVDIAYRIRRQQGQFNSPLLFHQDNVPPPHRSRLTSDYITNTLNWNVLPHPPYSPDLAPSDYHLFLSLKNFLRGRRFTEDTEVEEAVGQYLPQRMAQTSSTKGASENSHSGGERLLTVMAITLLSDI